MKSTIKQVIEEQYLASELLNDNALLLYSENQNSDLIDIKIRYVDHRAIKDQLIASVKRKSLTQGQTIVGVNHNQTAIAIFQRQEKDEKLVRLYSIEDHSFSQDDFIEVEYSQLCEKSPKILDLEMKR